MVGKLDEQCFTIFITTYTRVSIAIAAIAGLFCWANQCLHLRRLDRRIPLNVNHDFAKVELPIIFPGDAERNRMALYAR